MFGRTVVRSLDCLQQLSRAAPRTIATSDFNGLLRLSDSCKPASARCSTSTKAEDQPRFDMIQDGKRLSGAEFLEHVKTTMTKDDGSCVIPQTALETALAAYDSAYEQADEWKGKYQRSLAETENVRRRGQKQTEDANVFAIQGFCKDLLEVSDILDLALNSVKEEDMAKDPTLKALHDGIVMTKTVMLKTFSKHGLVQVNPMEEKFDPNLHEAVFQMPSSQTKIPAGHVAHVAKVGFLLKERPIRAAQVGVVAE